MCHFQCGNLCSNQEKRESAVLGFDVTLNKPLGILQTRSSKLSHCK